MAPSNSDREARESKQRLRNYQARQRVHASQVTRRKRDNLVSVIVVLVVVIVAIVVQVFYFSGGPGTPQPSPSASATAEPTASPSATPSSTENTGDVPPKSVAEGRDWTGTLTINDIPLAIGLDGVAAPQAVSSFISLVQAGFYTGLTCHRLTTTGIFVLQCGDPKGDGTGGPGYSYGPVENAPADNVYPAGTLAMARQGDNGYSNGSQFFIVYADSTIPSDTAGGYTVLGQVTSGLDQLQSGVIAAGVTSGTETPAVPATITNVTVQ
ncbi:peptidylprolyl isomerase [Subtercola boreus]|uniref:peptidylprolyl isomerase n=1 Tax=Subtercola boreus TaxID=120213 RepID=A0A3E0VTJ3_9MICO|nr:peptidylprolyl isomerase [Subtercola boreus]RFA12718.1 peptidylprolyl isomerase [Subtercola boreus]